MFNFTAQPSMGESLWGYWTRDRDQSQRITAPPKAHGIPTFQIFAPSTEPEGSGDDQHQTHPSSTSRTTGHIITQDGDRPRSGVYSANGNRHAYETSFSVPLSDSALVSETHISAPSAPPSLPPRQIPGVLRHAEPLMNFTAPRKGTSRSASLLERAGQKVSSRWGSTRSMGRDKRLSLTPKSGQYGVLEETEESDISGTHARLVSHRGHTGYRAVHAVDEAEDLPVGYDLSTLDGPISLQPIASGRGFNAALDMNEQVHGTLAAEFDQLEADAAFTGGLGGGMVGTCVKLDATKSSSGAPGPDLYQTSKAVGGGLSRGMTIRDVGRMEAKKLNQMVVINEAVPTVDISSFDANRQGRDETSVEQLKTRASMLTDHNQSSYYFPPDPEMPNWKPYSVRWPYLTLLIFLAFAMAGIQEFLYQLSAYRSQHNDGLLKFTKPKELSYGKFFCWKYMPTIIAVTYGVMWQIVDFEVKRLEPFYQLSRPEGALAVESLNRDYLTCWPIVAPFKAIKYRQWAVLYSSLVYLIAAPVVPVLQSASVIVTPDQEKRKPHEFKFVQMHPVWSRLLTSTLLLVGVLGCLVLFQLRRKSGLLSDPKGIAGVAAMANKSFILMDFKDLDTATEEAIHNRLKHRRYLLHKSSLWQGEYIRFGDGMVEQKKGKNPHPLMLRPIAGIPYISCMLLFMGFIPVLMFIHPVNNFGQRLPWLLTAMASVIKVTWSAVESDIRMMEPFYILSRRNAPSDILTLDYTGTIPGWLTIKAFLARHYLVALVGLGANMTEVLTVVVSSLSVRGDIFFPHQHEQTQTQDSRNDSEETFKSVWVSLGLAQGILCWLCLSATLVYYRRRGPFLPREPGSIASVMAFIHQSKMLVDFVETETMNSRDMTRHLRAKGKRYGLGWFKGRDKQDHCGIDEEPLWTDYHYDENFLLAVKPWSGTAWDRYDA